MTFVVMVRLVTAKLMRYIFSGDTKARVITENEFNLRVLIDYLPYLYT
jgi:hypothetical protein